MLLASLRRPCRAAVSPAHAQGLPRRPLHCLCTISTSKSASIALLFLLTSEIKFKATASPSVEKGQNFTGFNVSIQLFPQIKTMRNKNPPRKYKKRETTQQRRQKRECLKILIFVFHLQKTSKSIYKKTDRPNKSWLIKY